MFPDWLVLPALIGAVGQPVVVSLSVDEQLEE